jgi:hypothetical protein
LIQIFADPSERPSAESGVTAVDDRYSYDREKREALDAWGRRLEEILKEEDGW